MSLNVYLADSFPWLTQHLRAGDEPDAAIATMVDSRFAADLIIFPKADKEQPDATDRLRDFRPRELVRTCVYSQLDEPFPWAPGMYASVPAGYSRGGFVGGFYVAHHHYVEGGLGGDLDSARATAPDLLWSFVGTAANDPVRGALFGIEDDRAFVEDTKAWSERIRWRWRSDHKDEAREAFSSYAQLLGRSQFVLCPRGRGAGSIRLFEAMQVGRAPVIVSDDWLPPPFVDWDSCTVRVAERDVQNIPEILREREAEAVSLGERARASWEKWFAPERQLSTLVHGCILARETAPNRSYMVVKACARRDAVRRGLRRVKDGLRA